MEDVLDLYAEAPDPKRPRVCFDEMPYQLLSHTRAPLPCAPDQPAREDYEYKREGTCNLFAFFSFEECWRHVEVTERRTAIDFAWQMKWLVDTKYPEADVIRVVLDNLNTHTLASLYLAFPAEEANRLKHKLEFHYTPKHGSWLNMIELEFSVLSRQCLGQRLESRERVAKEAAAWETARNEKGDTLRWLFSTAQARTTLKHLYPALHA
jgi:transposase